VIGSRALPDFRKELASVGLRKNVEEPPQGRNHAIDILVLQVRLEQFRRQQRLRF
jgi:hypothetical protein